jgi:hypothetical protein
VLSTYAHVGLSGSGAWEYFPLGEHSVAMAKMTISATREWRESERALIYFLPVDLILPTILYIKLEKARRVLLVLNWGVTAWMPTVTAQASSYWICRRQGPRELGAGKCTQRGLSGRRRYAFKVSR